MKMIMTLINPVLQAVNWAVNGLQENAWPICLLLALGWFVKTQGRCRCLGAVWVLSGRCLGAVWALSGRCLGAVCHGDQRTRGRKHAVMPMRAVASLTLVQLHNRMILSCIIQSGSPSSHPRRRIAYPQSRHAKAGGCRPLAVVVLARRHSSARRKSVGYGSSNRKRRPSPRVRRRRVKPRPWRLHPPSNRKRKRQRKENVDVVRATIPCNPGPPMRGAAATGT
jgi:hypothetical protein